MRPILIAVVAALAAGPALAEEPVVAGAQPSVADQVEAFIRNSPVRAIPSEGHDGVVSGERGGDRRIHGEVAVGIGTHGYRSVYMRADMPVGDSGNLSVAFEDTRGRLGWRGGYGGGFAHGLRETRRAGSGCDLEALTPQRPLDVMGGPHGSCVRAPRR